MVLFGNSCWDNLFENEKLLRDQEHAIATRHSVRTPIEIHERFMGHWDGTMAQDES